MASKPVKGTKQVLIELPEPLVVEAKAFATERGQTFKDVVVEAMRRHLAYPPPAPQPVTVPPPVPFPGADAAPAPAKKKGGRK